MNKAVKKCQRKSRKICMSKVMANGTKNKGREGRGIYQTACRTGVKGGKGKNEKQPIILLIPVALDLCGIHINIRHFLTVLGSDK